MSQENFNEKEAVIKAIPDNQVIEPNMPVSVAVQEAEDLYEWAKDDEAVLTGGGLDVTLLNELPVRAGALRYAQSVWQKEYRTYEEAQKNWAQQSPEAFDMRDVIVHEFYHAYYNYPDLYAKVKTIDEGGSNADMLQDLSDLAILGKSNPDPLTTTNFDMTLLNTAENISENLSEVLAKANGLRLGDNEMKITRDKAYTYLKQAVDEVRRHGQYKFWRDNNRKKGYISQYFKSHGRKTVTKDVDTVVNS